jgi:hypothetical protein
MSNQTECSTPRCREPRIDGRRFCAGCAANLDRIREEFETDPLLLYNMRSDTRKDAESGAKRPQRPPTCCFPGCYEIRESGQSFCFAHENEGSEAA